MQRGLKGNGYEYAPEQRCYESQCKEDWKLSLKYSSGVWGLCLNAKRIESCLVGDIVLAVEEMKSQCKEDWKFHFFVWGLLQGRICLNAKRIEREIHHNPFRSVREVSMQRGLKVVAERAHRAPLEPVSMQRGLKVLCSTRHSTSLGPSLNAKRIESYIPVGLDRCQLLMSQCKEDWKYLTASETTSTTFRVSMQRGLKVYTWPYGIYSVWGVSMQRGLKVLIPPPSSWRHLGSLNAKRIESSQHLGEIKHYLTMSQCKEDWKKRR